jgi:hypothetical protein
VSFDFGKLLGGGGGGRRERRRMPVGEARPLLEEAEVERLFPQVGWGFAVGALRLGLCGWGFAVGALRSALVAPAAIFTIITQTASNSCRPTTN